MVLNGAVRFAMDRGGLVGADGATHGGAFDITYMACLPNMVVMAPSNEAELIHMVATSAAIDDRPSCFRSAPSSFVHLLCFDLGSMLQGSKQACAVASSMGCYDHPALNLRRLILFTSGCFVLLGGWCVSGVCEKWQSWLVQWTCNMD